VILFQDGEENKRLTRLGGVFAGEKPAKSQFFTPQRGASAESFCLSVLNFATHVTC